MKNNLEGLLFYDIDTQYKVGIDDLVGLQNVKEIIAYIKRYLNNPEAAEKLGLSLPSLLFTGPPGLGKSEVAKVIAKECNLPLFIITGGALLGGVRKDSGKKNIITLFNKAREQQKVVLVIDEMEAIAGRRDNDKTTVNETAGALQQLLLELDGGKSKKQIVFVGITNTPDELDGAITRPGRISDRIDFTNPDQEKRIQLFDQLISKHNTNNIDLNVMGIISSELSFAAIKQAINNALRKAFIQNTALTNEHIIEEIKRISSGILSDENKLDKKSEKMLLDHVAGHILPYMYLPEKFALGQIAIGAKINCRPVLSDKTILEVDDVFAELFSIYAAKEGSFQRTGAATSIYTDQDFPKAQELIKKLLLMLGSTTVDENKFKTIQKAMHEKLSSLAKQLLKEYDVLYKKIKNHLSSNKYLTREEFKQLINKNVKKNRKELFFELKKMITMFISIIKSDFVYQNIEQEKEFEQDKIIQT